MSVPRRTVLDICRSSLAAVICSTSGRAQTADQTLGPQIGDVFASADDHSRQITLNMLDQEGAPERVWPMDPKSRTVRDGARYNQVLLLRGPGNDAEIADTTDRVIAFSAICPHAACVVSEWIPNTEKLRCPCHGSEFDPWNNGTVSAGPAAPYALPKLPVRVTDGVITVAGPFSAKPGGHTSRTM
jgi:rieske iron-sulfur protein